MTGNYVPRTANVETVGTAAKPFGKIHSKDVVYSGHAYFLAVQTATGDGTTEIDWTAGNMMKFTFGAQSETFTFVEPDGATTCKLWVIQDGVGGRTITWPAKVEWGNNGTAPTLSTGASGKDLIILIYDDDGDVYTGGLGESNIA